MVQTGACLLQVFDLRATPRLLTSLPFGAGPSMLRFHPKFSATLLIAGAQGVFVLADASGASYNRTYQARSQRRRLAEPLAS